MVLIERETQLASLTAAMDAARTGQGSVVRVASGPGGGKTSLVRAFADDGGAARVLWGTCEDLITPLPLAPFLEIARQAGPAVETAFVSAREQAMTALLDTLEARPRPVLVVVEDVHWADQASLDLLALVAARIVRLPVVIVVTVRLEDASATVRYLLAKIASVRIDLPPLTHAGISQLAGKDLDAAALAELTGGNPFYVTELVKHGGDLTPSISETILVRISDLPDETRELLELLAMIPGRTQTRVLDRCRPGWEHAAEAAEARQILTIEAHEVTFAHELTREAVKSEILRSRQRRLHAEVLAAMQALDLPAGVLVHHASGAGDIEALLTLGPMAAADAAVAGSHREAAAHLRRVLEHADALPAERRAEFEEALSVEAWATARPDESVEAARRALAIHRSLGAHEAIGRNLRRVARVRWFHDAGDDAERLLDEAIEVLESADPRPANELAVTLAYRALLAGIRWSAGAAMAWSDRAISMLDQIDDRSRALALTDVGTVEYLHGDRGPELLLDAIAVSEKLGMHVDVVRAQVNLAAGALLRRDHNSAMEWLDRSDDFARDHQVSMMRGASDTARAQIHLERGEWDHAELLARGVVEDSDESGFARLPALITLARLRVRRGDVEASETIDDSWERAAFTDEAQRLAPAAGTAGEHAWMLGRPEDALGRMRAAHRRSVESGVPRWIGETAFWLHALGALDDDSVEVEFPHRSMLRGEFVTAAEAWDDLGCPYEAALARVLSDDPDQMLGALEVLDQLGAGPLSRRARTRLRELGVEKVPRGPRPTTLANPAGLTARQMDVLRLLPNGYTNAEIADRLYLSTRTVDHHVAAILLKLEVSSRQEAALRADELDLID